MIENEKPTKRKWTPTQHAVRLNSGAAYAAATGDLIGGMEYTHSQSRDLSDDPIVQRTMANAEIYISTMQKYQNALDAWEKNKENEKPQIEQPKELAIAEIHYKNLIYASKIRTEKFEEFYARQTLQEARESTFYDGKLPRNLSDIAKEAIETADQSATIKNIAPDTPMGQTIKAIKKYHIIGKTAEGVAMRGLEQTLNKLHK